MVNPLANSSTVVFLLTPAGRVLSAERAAPTCLFDTSLLKLLVERGADRSIKDDLYHSTAEGGAEYFGRVEVRDYLRSLEV